MIVTIDTACVTLGKDKDYKEFCSKNRTMIKLLTYGKISGLLVDTSLSEGNIDVDGMINLRYIDTYT